MIEDERPQYKENKKNYIDIHATQQHIYIPRVQHFIHLCPLIKRRSQSGIFHLQQITEQMQTTHMMNHAEHITQKYFALSVSPIDHTIDPQKSSLILNVCGVIGFIRRTIHNLHRVSMLHSFYDLIS